MAAQILRKGQAIVWVPPRAIGERAFANEAVLLAMLPTAGAGAGKRTGKASQSGFTGAGNGSTARYTRLSLEALPALKSVTLVFDARDVTLLRATVPPLSGVRLQQALPNIVEDLLLQDAQLCGFALGPKLGEGERLIAAIDLQWLEHVVGAFERRGARVTAAWPAQLALPIGDAEAALCCVNDGLALRIGALDGIGWNGSDEAAHRHEAIVSLLQAALPEPLEAPAPADADALSAASALAEPALAGEAAASRAASVPTARRLPVYIEGAEWQPAVESAAAQLGVMAEMQGLPFPQASPIDLLGARRGSAARRWLADVDWRAWRTPAAFALASVVLALVGLNVQWGMLTQERDALRTAIEQRYRQAFPETQVIVDPVLQMERQVSSLRTAAGQTGPEDFVPLLARFSQALGAQAADSLAGIEFRDGRLRVRFQPGSFDSQAVRNSLIQASQRLGLQLRFDSEREPTASVGLLR
jgi:general secretion pathway protein L